jgi:hypothetical protein
MEFFSKLLWMKTMNTKVFLCKVMKHIFEVIVKAGDSTPIG